jgi:hypothetical protein
LSSWLLQETLKPGDRTGISDVDADDSLTSDQRAERGDYVRGLRGSESPRKAPVGEGVRRAEQGIGR